MESLFDGMNYKIVEDLHLAVSLRSFRSELVSAFVKALLDIDRNKAMSYYQLVKPNYPIYMTRNLNVAKTWIKNQANGTERYGLTASSGAKRLKAHGVWVQSKIDAKNWFLNDKNDVRSSYFMEDVATEFDIQGLELDWSIVCWDANLRFENDEFKYFSFTGSKWMNINNEENAGYLKNAYPRIINESSTRVHYIHTNG